MLLLKNENIDFKIVDYQKTGITKEEILQLASMLGVRPKEFLRKFEKDFKENNIGNYLDNDSKIAEYVSRYPKIMERPIFVNEGKAVIGRPPDNVLELL